MRAAAVPSASLWPFAGHTLVCPYLSDTGEPSTGHSTPAMVPLVLRARITHLDALVMLSLMLHRMLGLHAQKTSVLHSDRRY